MITFCDDLNYDPPRPRVLSVDDLDADAMRRAREAYSTQKHNARQKPRTRLGERVQMRLTFDEWLDIWLKSGWWHLRGKGNGKYVMCRYGDDGHYELGNVYIGSHLHNIRAGGGRPRVHTRRPVGRLGAELVREIAAAIDAGMTLHQAADKFSIGYRTAHSIKNRHGRFGDIIEPAPTPTNGTLKF